MMTKTYNIQSYKSLAISHKVFQMYKQGKKTNDQKNQSTEI